MDANALQTFKALGRINAAIASATSFDRALHACIHILYEAFNITYAAFWSANSTTSELRPTYWLGSIDLTDRTHIDDDSAVWEVFITQQTQRILDSTTLANKSTSKDYADCTIRTMVCAPLSNRTNNLGVLQLINKEDGSFFSQEEADVIEVCAMVCGMNAPHSNVPARAWLPGRVLMSAHDVTRDFANGETTTQVLQGINLNVFDGEFLVLLGESGCGKSTLLNILGGLDEPTSGTVLFNGAEHTAASDRALTAFRRKNVGFVFQSYNLMPTLSVRRNLTLISELVDDPLPIDEALEIVGLGDRKKSRPSQLSGGQQQRLSIARALVKKPPLILADEPTAALDYETSIEVLQAFERVRQTGTTIVMVTHNEEICRMANRVIRMRDGRMCETTINHAPARAQELEW